MEETGPLSFKLSALYPCQARRSPAVFSPTTQLPEHSHSIQHGMYLYHIDDRETDRRISST